MRKPTRGSNGCASSDRAAADFLSQDQLTVTIPVTVPYHPLAPLVQPVTRTASDPHWRKHFMQRSLVRFGVAALAALALIFSSYPAPAAAVGLIGSVQGHVTDALTGLPITNACVWFGPVHIVRSDPLTNCVFTDAAGFYSHSWINTTATIPLTFEKDPTYQQKTIDTVVNSDQPVTVDAKLDLVPGAPPPGQAGCQAATVGI